MRKLPIQHSHVVALGYQTAAPPVALERCFDWYRHAMQVSEFQILEGVTNVSNLVRMLRRGDDEAGCRTEGAPEA